MTNKVAGILKPEVFISAAWLGNDNGYPFDTFHAKVRKAGYKPVILDREGGRILVYSGTREVKPERYIERNARKVNRKFHTRLTDLEVIVG